MRRQHLVSCGLICMLGLVPGIAFAQMGGSGSRMGASGSSGFGTAGFGSSIGGGTGSTSFGNMGSLGTSGGGGMGAGGMGAGGMGMGMGGMGQGGMGQQGMGGQQGGNFIGTNANQNQFLGRNGQGQQGAMGMNGMMNQLGGNRGGAGRNNGNNVNTMNSMFGGANNSNANNQPVIRPRQKVAFEYTVAKGEVLQTKLQNHLTKVALRNPNLTNVMLTTDGGGEVTMRGAVANEAQAKLAANLLRLEPGVRTIRNELTFPPAKSDAE